MSKLEEPHARERIWSPMMPTNSILDFASSAILHDPYPFHYAMRRYLSNAMELTLVFVKVCDECPASVPHGCFRVGVDSVCRGVLFLRMLYVP